jgi:hypothetical protein
MATPFWTSEVFRGTGRRLAGGSPLPRRPAPRPFLWRKGLLGYRLGCTSRIKRRPPLFRPLRLITAWVACAALLAIPDLASAAVYEVYGTPSATGSVISSGMWGPYKYSSAELRTRFSEFNIEPGEGFTFNSWVDVSSDCGGEDTCGSSGPTETDYDTWGFWRFDAGGQIWESGGPPAGTPFDVTVSAPNTQTETYNGFGTSFTYSSVMSVEVPGEETAGWAPGCYLSTHSNAHIWFGQPEGGMNGTVDMLRVGNVSCEPQCSDGVNNDLDGPAGSSGLVDYPDDPGCTRAEDPSEFGTVECDNGTDDEPDGKADWPADSGCSSATDETEGSPQCSDNSSNDFDGLVDWPFDPGCTGPDDLDELAPPEVECDNGLDDDGDGGYDWPADKECDSAIDTTEKSCYRTEAAYDVAIADGGRVLRTYDTGFMWCVAGGRVDPRFPVATGWGAVPPSWVDRLLAQFGYGVRSDGDWKEAQVLNEGAGATVKTYPELKTCVDFAQFVSLIPIFRAYKFGKPAWKRLPQSLRKTIVANAMVAVLAYLPPGWARTTLRRLLQRVPSQVVRRLVAGTVLVWCDDIGIRGTVSIALSPDGTASAAVQNNSPNSGYDWNESKPQTTTPLDLRRQVGAVPQPDGSLLAITQVAGPGRITSTADGGGGRGASATKRVVFATGRKKVRRPGVVRIVLRPTKAGRRLLRRKRTAKVRVRVVFTADGGGRTTASNTAKFGIPPKLRRR